MAPVGGITFLVTGATGGIGRAFVESLAGSGAQVIVHGRSAQRVEETVRAISARGVEATGLIADLASLDETALLAEQALALGRPIDVLINNAGVGFGRDRTRRETSRDGFELRFAVNYLAPVLLTRKLIAGGMPRRAVVNVASAGHEALELDDLQSTRHYDGVQAYRRSKLALISFTFDLAEETKVAVNALHPGTFLDSGMVRESGIQPLGPVSRGRSRSATWWSDRWRESVAGTSTRRCRHGPIRWRATTRFDGDYASARRTCSRRSSDGASGGIREGRFSPGSSRTQSHPCQGASSNSTASISEKKTGLCPKRKRMVRTVRM
jgi:NAD(P)-dependent dehydrogenase (short-subunit alcohol dehydrogenase family)